MSIEVNIDRIANSLGTIAELLEQLVDPTVQAVRETQPAPTSASVTPLKKAAKVDQPQAAPALTKEQVNEALQQVVEQLGGDAAPIMRLMTEEFGVATLHALNPALYQGLVNKAQELAS